MFRKSKELPAHEYDSEKLYLEQLQKRRELMPEQETSLFDMQHLDKQQADLEREITKI